MRTGSTNSKYFLRDARATQPKLALATSFWALSHRPRSLMDALEHECNDGVEYLEVGFREERLDDTTAALRAFPLQLIGQGWATQARELVYFFQKASDLGAVALNLHLGHAYMGLRESLEIIGEAQALASRYSIPMLIETHRGRLTQDLFRTDEIAQRARDLTFALDISHYLVAGETLGGSEVLFRRHLAPILARTGLIHGRISNGQSIQVPADDPSAYTDLLVDLWTEAMRTWLHDAPQDAVLIFEPELGPPPYAYRAPGGVETFSREDESRRLSKIARQAWASAAASNLTDTTVMT